MSEKKIVLTEKQIEEIFYLWNNRIKKDPKEFMSEKELIDKNDLKAQSKEQAKTFMAFYDVSKCNLKPSEIKTKPKEKANELVTKYFNLPCCESVESAKFAAKICVKEVLLSIPNYEDETSNYWNMVKVYINQY